MHRFRNEKVPVRDTDVANIPFCLFSKVVSKVRGEFLCSGAKMLCIAILLLHFLLLRVCLIHVKSLLPHRHSA